METIECSSETGITIDLIEGMIAQLRVLSKRELTSQVVKEALMDLKQNSPWAEIMKDIPNG